MKNLLVAQSGGPTAAINSTLCGVLTKARKVGINHIYGAKFGIKGLLKRDIVDLDVIKESDIKTLKLTPASVLGSCRYKLKDIEDAKEEYENIVEILREFNVGYMVYIGGNDSMDTVEKFSRYLKLNNILDIKIIGAPKTIDNDLKETDHCPGFGSAAKYVATTFKELERDSAVYDIKAVTLVETMGRDAGWLTAASCLSRLNHSPGPSLIYCCEVPFSVEKFLMDIEEKLKEKPNVLVALSEGLKDENKRPISADYNGEKKDMFGHSNNAGVAKFLEEVVKKNMGVKVRSVELNISQRAAVHIASLVDIEESFKVGEKAVELLKEGRSGLMVRIIRREEEQYGVEYGFVEAFKVANKVKTMPKDFISSNYSDVSEKTVKYLKPLIKGEVNLEYVDGVPRFYRLDEFSK